MQHNGLGCKTLEDAHSLLFTFGLHPHSFMFSFNAELCIRTAESDGNMRTNEEGDLPPSHIIYVLELAVCYDEEKTIHEETQTGSCEKLLSKPRTVEPERKLS